MNAKWIWIDKNTVSHPRMVVFKKNINIKDKPVKCNISILADSRYTLCINGNRVATGPCRAPSEVWYTDELDIAEYLKAGQNQILVKVIQYGANKHKHFNFTSGPASILTEGVGGLWIEEKETQLGINTSEDYLCISMEGYKYLEENNYGYVGCAEYYDAGAKGEYSPDSLWQTPVALSKPVKWGIGSIKDFWESTPRPIPMAYEKKEEYARLVRSSNYDKDLQVIKAGTEGVIELDAGRLVNAYPVLEIDCGKGSKAELTYAEGYGSIINGQFVRGVRDDPQNQEICGHTDTYIAIEGEQKFIPFAYRCFRVVKICIAASPDRDVIIKKNYFIKTGYPLEITGDFTSDDPVFGKIWSISLRTLQRCMYDTYMDCPYYEQMQYAMDTFLQIRYTLSVSSDSAMARKAILDFSQAQLPSGLMPCNSPAIFHQMIPGFPFYWVLMLDTYMLYTDDKKFVHSQLGVMDKLLEYYRLRSDERGLLGDCGYWQFFDWVKEWNNGCPVNPGEENILYDMLYIMALRKAAGINRYCGRNCVAEEYETIASKLCEAVIEIGFDKERGLFRDVPGKAPASMHAQIFAVVASVVDEEQQVKLMKNMIQNKDALAVPSYCFTYFLCRALEQTGMYSSVSEVFDIWSVYEKLESQLHLTTWPEDFVTLRSDCHGWSAVPLYELANCFLGVRPLTPGFGKIGIIPQPCPLNSYGGRVPVGKGEYVEVSYKKVNGKTQAELIHAPENAEIIVDYSKIF